VARPRAINEDNWYDIFGDWDLEDQAAAIKVLQQIHRQLKRTAEPAVSPKIQLEAAQAMLQDMSAGAED
jgi:hypothetical protein